MKVALFDYFKNGRIIAALNINTGSFTILFTDFYGRFLEVLEYMAVANGLCEHPPNSPLFDEGTLLAKDLINYKLGRNVPPVNGTAKTLRKLSDDIEQRNPDLLEQLCSKLNFSKETGYNSFCEIAKEVFADGIINWGRIVVLFAFCAKLGKYCNENNMSDEIENITQWTARFVTGLGWIEAQGGWNGLNNRFQALGENNSNWWKSALITTALGIGSLAVFTVCK